MGVITTILVGGVAGWLAGKVMKGEGYGPLMNVLLGILGGFVGEIVFDLVGLKTVGLVGRIVCAFAGSVLVVWLARQLSSK
ncbi:MAG: GlsB/YeaQ/YmgE family stress response membrane protein [Flavobacteriales bacterium]|nr:GlsB/YeaQ/YmgE family stress response membrane protein [Flavobacteriales bacterium]MBL0045252.1 GlsB/YeaQ/YmgE family stress response membrane protein [Flavobacteriales bacterium]